MRMAPLTLVAAFLGAFVHGGMVTAQPRTPAQSANGQLAGRISIAAGMGVDEVNAQDIVDRVNGTVVRGERVPDFKAAVEFFGNICVPLSPDWALKLEYAYLLGSFSPETPYGPGEFTFTAHMPSLMIFYVLVDDGLYDVRIGCGGGYHVGAYREKYPAVDDRFSGSGVGAILELDAHTAFGEDLYGYVGGVLRWGFIGKLRNEAGNPPRTAGLASPPTLHFFSAGARLGLSYYL